MSLIEVHNDFTYSFKSTKDYTKRTLRLPELMLKIICMWPSVGIKKQRICYLCFITFCIFTLWGLFNYLIEYIQDYEKSLNVVSCMSTMIQTSLKLTMLQYHSSSLNEVLDDISKKFWPYNLLPECSKKLKTSYHSRLTSMYLLLCPAMLFTTGCLISPLINNTVEHKELPYRSIYNFDITLSPVYEFFYIFQCILNAIVINCSVLGFDYLFMGVVENLISQYILLGKTIEKFGTQSIICFNNKIKQLRIEKNFRNDDEDTFFLRTFIKHHQILVSTSKKVENIFNLIAALQLCSSVVAICVSGFISTRDNVSKAQIGTMGSYLIGHLIQLYLYCAIGNELIYESSNLSKCIFGSNWSDIKSVKLKKDLVFVIKNAQISAKITAFKVFTLNYSTYIKVLRLSFSFYTLLSSLVDVKTG